jgi:hypothetical protein
MHKVPAPGRERSFSGEKFNKVCFVFLVYVKRYKRCLEKKGHFGLDPEMAKKVSFLESRGAIEVRMAYLLANSGSCQHKLGYLLTMA